jgi:hypothetical protein
MKPTSRTGLGVALVAAWLASACGSGGTYDDGDGVGGNDNGIPTATVDEFSTWVASRDADDTAEPLDVSRTQPPTSESAEPLPLG